MNEILGAIFMKPIFSNQVVFLTRLVWISLGLTINLLVEVVGKT
ncbi:hypothetical protein AM1_1128 [Acaryochloris marina MBIC11017]|uniref:Uncharacterized protein n=1 Tax=Acaryochloris marina (strain MBIC 11017) TaxID=329726 RepID=B0C2V1_ACAM1|nr:hypothetical protein AM1_1128 [Acaryochloris marina MBIC11017]